MKKTLWPIAFATLACVASAQVEDEQVLGDGFEPSVITNRQATGTTHDGVVVSWLYKINQSTFGVVLIPKN